MGALAVSTCDGLEFDVRAAADGVPVVIHDETLARVQRLPERVDGMTAAALRQVGIPTLAETRRAVARNLKEENKNPKSEIR